MQSTEEYQLAFLEYLKGFTKTREPKNLYNPVNYILELGGKRLRPVLTLMTAEIFNTDYKKALSAALSIEVFHNFSLVHDDIMDDAPLRRGKQTVHEKWDVNTGILSGDAMLIMAYQLFENYEPNTFLALAKLFSKTALEVCEGQQYDIDFETRDDVTIPEYLKMIEYKTAVLVGAAMKMGAIVANASVDDQNSIYEFGKQVGGDIIENKKTYLYLKALEFLNSTESNELQQLFTVSLDDNSEKIKTVKQFFISSGSSEATKKEIENYTNKAFTLLKAFGNTLMTRKV